MDGVTKEDLQETYGGALGVDEDILREYRKLCSSWNPYTLHVIQMNRQLGRIADALEKIASRSEL